MYFMEREGALQSVWNFDGAELALVFEIKQEVIERLRVWDLEGTYWKLREFRAELDAKQYKKMKDNVEPPELAETKRLMEELEEQKNIFNSTNPTSESLSKFYSYLETFYMYLCRLMKKHGLFFREGDDPSQAIFQR